MGRYSVDAVLRQLALIRDGKQPVVHQALLKATIPRERGITSWGTRESSWMGHDLAALPAPEQGQTGVVHLLEPLKKRLRYQGVKNVHTLGGDEYLPPLGDKAHLRAKVMPTHFRILSPRKPAVSDTCRRVYAHSHCLPVLASYK